MQLNNKKMITKVAKVTKTNVTKTNKVKIITILLFLSIGLTMSCSQDDQDKVGEAQLCLDKATTSTASTCMSKVTGLDSPAANNIRCSALFIQEGFSDGSKIINALNAISSGSGASQMQSFMGLIGFSSQNTISANDTNAANAYSYCYKSGSKGALLLSVYSYLTTSIVKFMHDADAVQCPDAPNSTTGFYDLSTSTGCLKPTAGILAAIVKIVDPNTLDSSAAALQTSLGAVLRTMYTVTCAGGASANKTLCSSLTSTVGAAPSDRRAFTNFFTTISQ